DDLATRARGAELREVDRIDAPHADATKSRREAIDLATDAETGRRSEQRERDPDDVEPDQVGARCRSEKYRTDDVRESRWAAVLDGSLADARLDHLEI